MPCTCFGKKDKKAGGGLLGEEEKYRPRDSRERDPPTVPILPPPTPPSTQSQTQPLLGATPPSAPGTPPSTPLATTPSTPPAGGDGARLRPEDDPDKATRRRDVVASFYSDQCELIGFKATGSRPPSAHVGGSLDGPAATSSPATSSPSSIRSAGAFCRADLAEKRREFFKELTLDDDDTSRPTSRLTDPGSQQTPRHSHYQEHHLQHNTLPHLKKTPKSNRPPPSSSPPLFLQHPLLLKNSPSFSPPPPPPVSSSEDEDTLPLLLHSSSSPQQTPKIVPKETDPHLFEIPSDERITSPSDIFFLHDDPFNDPLLLSDNKQTLPNAQMVLESSVSIDNQQVSPENSFYVDVQSPFKSEPVVDINTFQSSEFIVDVSTPPVNSDVNVMFVTEPIESSKLLVDTPSIESQELISNLSISENAKVFDLALAPSPVVEISPANVNSQVFDVEMTTSQTPEFKVDVPCAESENMLIDMSIPASSQNVDQIAVDSQPMRNNNSPKVISVTPKMEEPFLQLDSPFVVDSQTLENPVSYDHQFDVEFSHKPTSPSSTLPVIVNETLKQQPPPPPPPPPKEHHDDNYTYTYSSFESPVEGSPQTIVETTRQFILNSPDERKTSETIVETTRHLITGPSDEPNSQTTVERAQEHQQQFESGTPDEQKSTHTIVETTRQFISGVPEDDEATQELLEAAQQYFSDGNPDEQLTRTVVQTTHRSVSGDPDEGRNAQTTVVTTTTTTQQPFPDITDSFFLTSVEEPDEFPQKLLLQTNPTTTHTLEEELLPPTSMPRSLLFDVEEGEELEGPTLPDVPCFGAPPPPSSPPPPLSEGPGIEDPFASSRAVVSPPGEEQQLSPPAPPTPPAEEYPEPSAPPPPLIFEEQEQQQPPLLLLLEGGPTPPSPPSIPHGEKEENSPSPQPPTPKLGGDVQLVPSSPPPMANEQLPPTPPTPHREDELPPAPPTPPKGEEDKKVIPAPHPSITTTPPAVTCGVEIVSSSTLEDDGIGSEIDEALESLEGLSEEGNKKRAAATSS